MNAKYSLTVNSNPYGFIKIKFDHEPRDVSKSPTFDISIPNPFGVLATSPDFQVGKNIQILRNNSVVFKGVILPYTFTMNPSDSTLTIKGTNTFYAKMDNVVCDSYDFQEDKNDVGVTINPWDFKVLRHTHPLVALDPLTGESPILDGFSTEKVVQHVCGTKFLYAHDFTDSSHVHAIDNLKATQQVYRSSTINNVTGYYQTTPRLQITPNNMVSQTSGSSYALYEADYSSAGAYRLYGRSINNSFALAVQRVNSSTAFTINGLRVYLQKIGNPTGNITLRWTTNFNANSVIISGGTTQTVAISSMPTGAFYQSFSAAAGLVGQANTDYYFSVEYAGGDENNYIAVYYVSPPSYPYNAVAQSSEDAYGVQANINGVLTATTTIFLQGYNNYWPFTDSVNLMNGDPNVGPMGLISTATVTLYGRLNNNSNSVSVYASARQDQGRVTMGPGNPGSFSNSYYLNPVSSSVTSVPVPGTSDFVTKWVFNFDFTGVPGFQGNVFGYRIEMDNSSASTTTPEVEYVMVECNTVSDTGVNTNGVLETYSGDPTITSSKFFEGNLESLSRLAALRKVQESTLKLYDASDPYNPIDTQLTTYWDIWLDVNGNCNFKKVRGTMINYPTYSFENKNIEGVEYEFDGSEIWWNVIAYGAGSGIARTRIVDPGDVGANFTNPGLTNLTALSTYGDAAKTGSYSNSNATSVYQLQKLARATLKLHSKPFQYLKLPNGILPEFNMYYNVGDAINITITDLNILAQWFPIDELTRTIDKDGEHISPVLGSQQKSIVNALSVQHDSTSQLNIVRQPVDSSSSSAASGTYFDNTTYGLFTFGISDPDKVTRLALKIVTVPYTAQLTLTSPPAFGISAFDGDGGSGNINNAIYASNVSVWLDTVKPPTSADVNAKLPIIFGQQDRSIEIDELDVTPFLARDGTGKIKRGIHRVWVKSGTTSSPNTHGLGCVQIVPLFTTSS